MSRERQMGPLGSMILGVIFIVVGYTIGFIFGKPILDNAKASTEWPEVDGVVIESEVTTSRSDGNTVYSAHVLYEYKVGKKKYKADTVSFGGSYSSSSSSEHHEVIDRYPKGKKVKVSYNPDSHEIAALEPGATWKSYLIFGIGLLFLVIGIAAAGIPLCIFGFAMFATKSGRNGASPWQDDAPAQPWTGGSSEAPGTSGGTPPAKTNRADMKDDGFDVG